MVHTLAILSGGWGGFFPAVCFLAAAMLVSVPDKLFWIRIKGIGNDSTWLGHLLPAVYLVCVAVEIGRGVPPGQLALGLMGAVLGMYSMAGADRYLAQASPMAGYRGANPEIRKRQDEAVVRRDPDSGRLHDVSLTILQRFREEHQNEPIRELMGCAAGNAQLEECYEGLERVAAFEETYCALQNLGLVYGEMGCVKAFLGEYEQAVRDLEKAAACENGLPDASEEDDRALVTTYHFLAHCHARLQHPQETEHYVRLGLDADRKDWQAHNDDLTELLAKGVES
jgi:tetratricopeptide (TPR) repeat protein